MLIWLTQSKLFQCRSTRVVGSCDYIRFLDEVSHKDGWFLNSFLSHEAMLMWSYFWWKDLVLYLLAGWNFIEDFKHDFKHAKWKVVWRMDLLAWLQVCWVEDNLEVEFAVVLHIHTNAFSLMILGTKTIWLMASVVRRSPIMKRSL
jgi:hypothetical protein